MANLHMELSRGSTDYSDGSVENDLFDIVKEPNPDYDRIIANDRRWPVLYHLSHLRENILNWYPFAPGAEILEVGAGCGAVTGALCAAAGHVTAVELTERRAKINYYRHRDLDNLDIYAGDMFQIHFEQKFDYITLIGVLEYAGLMCHGEKPYQQLLKWLKSMLKPGGRLLIAIENRFGLKYFAGAREDHTGGFFDGINGYPNGGPARTFTQTELKAVLREAGFDAPSFYYPLPDYKFPKMIYTEESIRDFDPNLNFEALDRERFRFFGENKVGGALAREGALGTFANSFFVDTEPMKDKVLMARISTERKPFCRVMTRICQSGGELYAEKKTVGRESLGHLQKMARYDGKSMAYDFQPLPAVQTAEDTLRYPFLKGESLLFRMDQALADKDKAAFLALVEDYHRRLFAGTAETGDFYSEDFRRVFGEAKEGRAFHCAPVSNVDMNFDNVIFSGTEAYLLDYEWCFPFPVPAEFIFWRAVRNAGFPENVRLDLYRHYGVTEQIDDLFKKWEFSFLNEYIGSFDLKQYSFPSVFADWENVLQAATGNILTSSVYWDEGAGFSEKDHAFSAAFSFGPAQTVTFSLNEKPLTALRFDPCEKPFTGCTIKRVTSDAGELSWHAANAAFSDGATDYFITRDPQYGVEWKGLSPKKITVTFSVISLPPEKIEEKMREERRRVREERRRTQKIQQELQDSLAEERRNYEQVVSSASWRVTEPLRSLRRRFGNR